MKKLKARQLRDAACMLFMLMCAHGGANVQTSEMWQLRGADKRPTHARCRRRYAHMHTVSSVFCVIMHILGVFSGSLHIRPTAQKTE